jgi:hypothetical protein
MMRLIAEQAVRIAGSRPVHIGPVTLRPRVNAVATSPPRAQSHTTVEQGYAAEYVPGATDPRQRGVGYAAWLIASAAALAVPGVAGLSYAEAWGPRGFGEVEGRPFPAAQSLSWLAALSGWQACAARGALPVGVGVLAARRGNELVILAANIADRPAAVVLDPGERITDGILQRLSVLPSRVVLPASGDLLRLELGPAEAVRWTAGRGVARPG